MTTDLVFGTDGAYTPPSGSDVPLIFGFAPGTPGSTTGFTVAGQLRLRGGMVVRQAEIHEVEILGRLRLRGSVAAHYDPAVSGILESRCDVAWRGAAVQAAGKALPWRTAGIAQGDAEVSANEGVLRSTETVVPWAPTVAHQIEDEVPWRAGKPIDRSDVLPWRAGKPIDRSDVLPWRNGRPMRREVALPWGWGVPGERKTALPWRDGRQASRETAAAWAGAVRAQRETIVPWRGGRFIHTHGNEWVRVPDPVDPPPELVVSLVFCHPLLTSTSSVLFGDPTPCIAYHSIGATVVVPIKKVYLVINDTHLIKTDGMVELPTLSMSLSIDVDSWTYSWSATLPAGELPRVMPAGDGTPVELAMVINGETYLVLAENITRSRQFGSETIRIGGRGRNAILDKPYAQVQSFTNTAARTAAQLLNDALTVNGESLGWAVDFGLTDWLVPAGAWNHQGSHITAAMSVASAAGGYLQASPQDSVLQVLARYPTAPWDWGGVTPDFELPAAVMRQEGITWTEKPRYNRVFVSGASQGVVCQVTRTGTAGDVVAQMIVDPLITEAAAGRQRGTNVLADTGPIATVSLGLPVLAETGIIHPGKFVRYVDGGVTRIGIVRSTGVEVSGPTVWQSLGVETHG